MWVLNKQTDKGDTIVEVLIALSIIGIALAGAYAAANRGIQVTQQARERTQATKIVEGQLEVIKSKVVAGGDTASEVYEHDSFCITAGGAVLEHTIETLPERHEAELTSGEEGEYPEECVFDEFYHVHIANQGGDRFSVSVRWHQLGGSGIDQVHIGYGINETVATVPPELEEPEQTDDDINAITLNVSNRDRFTIELSWTSGGSNVDQYELYRDGSLIETLNSSTTSYANTELQEGTEHEYYVIASNDSNSVQSEEVRATTYLRIQGEAFNSVNCSTSGDGAYPDPICYVLSDSVADEDLTLVMGAAEEWGTADSADPAEVMYSVGGSNGRFSEGVVALRARVHFWGSLTKFQLEIGDDVVYEEQEVQMSNTYTEFPLSSVNISPGDPITFTALAWQDNEHRYFPHIYARFDYVELR